MKFGWPARKSCPPDLGAVIAAAAMSWATWRTVPPGSPRGRGCRSCRSRHLALAPGVEGVVDEGASFEQAVVVGFDVQSAHADGQQPGPGRVGVQVVVLDQRAPTTT